ncbi:MAG: hypothetical protein KF790_01820 [Steroidobacteraceae bacterium]|nr:hypothetical protein [Steroidobacteraceae bacterium]
MTRTADRLKGWAPWLFALAALLLVVHWASTRPLERRPGVLAPDEPVQTAIDVAAPIDAGHGFRLTPRAQFAATVRVLASERYYIDAMAPIAPVDLAVGWGPMSDTAVLGALSISQSARFYFWQGRELPLPPADITRHSANWHIVPASATVYRTLRQLRPGQLIHLSGELVDVEGPDGGSARTSLSRNDTGAGACEIIHVETLETVGG